MSLALSILLSRVYYYPGDVLGCVLKVVSEGPPQSSLHVNDLTFECVGSERLDTSWVSKVYLPDVPGTKENCRLNRKVINSEGATLLSNHPLAGGGHTHSYALYVKLPKRLPPSFRGSAVRYTYAVQARAEYTIDPTGKPRVADAHASFVVWPHSERTLERRTSLPSGSPIAMHSAEDTEPAMIEYRLMASNCRIKWQATPLQLSNSASPLLLPQPSLSSPTASLGHEQTGLQRQNTLWSAESLTASDFNGLTGLETAGGQSFAEPAQDLGGADESVAGGLKLTPLQRHAMAARSYNLRAGDHPLVKVTLHPPLETLLQPGGTVGGVLDFRASHGTTSSNHEQPTCIQVVVLLETEEVINAPYRHASSSSTSGAIRKLYAEHQELTSDTLLTHFVFSIPPNAPQSFRTPMVGLRWVLRFELTLLVPPKANVRRKPTPEQLTWTLPIIVFPPPRL